MSTTLTPTDGTTTTLTLTSLNSLTNSATVGWISDRVDNTSTKASDFRITMKFAAVNTAPANDKAIYVYVVAWHYDGTTWYTPDGGTTTLPPATVGAYTIASPNNLGTPIMTLNYTTQNQPIQGTTKLSNKFGMLMPNGWSLVVINFTGMTLAAASNYASYCGITYLSV